MLCSGGIARAGASQHALASETTAEVTDQLFALNALGPIKLTRAVVPLMLSRGKGRIVVVASMSSKASVFACVANGSRRLSGSACVANC